MNNRNEHAEGAGSQSGSQRFACRAARLLSDNACEDVVALDVRGISQVTDFFVIATGTSERQMRSVLQDLERLAELDDEGIYGSNAKQGGSWLVLDVVDVVVHLFTYEQRAYYDLASLWGDATRVDWRSVTTPGEFADIRARIAARRRPDSAAG